MKILDLRPSTRGLVAGLLTALFLGGLPAAVEAGTIVRAESNGLSTRNRDRLRPSHFFIDGDRLKLADASSGRHSIVRLDREVVYEVDPSTETYVERDFSSFQEMREEKRAENDELIEMLVEQERVAPAEADRILSERGLRADGATIATTNWTDERRTIAGYEARRVQVLRNDIVMFDVWVTEELDRPTGLVELYRAIGAYSPIVTHQVRSIPGFPLRIRARLDIIAQDAWLVLEATEVTPDAAIPEGEFEVDESFRRIDPDDQDIRVCPECGREFDWNIEGTTPQPLANGDLAPFCSTECAVAYQERLAEQEEERESESETEESGEGP